METTGDAGWGCQRLVCAYAAAIAIALGAPLVSLAAQDLVTAEAAFMQQRFPDADTALRAVLAHGTVADRKKAALGLAVIDWKIRGDTARAMRDLRPFAAEAPALTMMSRARLDAGNAAGARAAARAAIAAARNGDDRRDALVALADALSYQYDRSCIDSARAHAPAHGDSAVRAGIALLRTEVSKEPGRLAPAERLVRLAAISGDWSALAAGWRSYYVIGRRVPDGPLVRAEAELRALEGSRPRDRAAHAFAALMASKMFEPAALIATCGALAPVARDSTTAEIIAYARFLRVVRRATDAYYREIALGHGNVGAWKARLDSAGRKLWPALIHDGARPEYSLDSLQSDLDRRFDLVANSGTTGGVIDFHAGHRISNEDREVNQYGHAAHIRFAVLDGMISDGYQTWAWDGNAAHGGWATDVVIIQVRPAYADGPIRAWHAITDPVVVARDAKALAADSIADIARAKGPQQIAFYPSVEKRLLRNARLSLLDSLKLSGISGSPLQAAFERAYGDEVDESSIFAHEGRHAIDRALHLADSTPANLEYRAKLSEVAFAPSPKLALSGILGANIGDESPHGTANAKVLRGLLSWMSQHAAELGASSEPLVLRIPTLSDEQLRTAMRSLDPFTPAGGT